MLDFKNILLIWKEISLFEQFLIIGGLLCIIILLIVCIYYIFKRVY